MEGLIERGAYLKFWLRGEGLIREGAKQRGGLNRAFTVTKESKKERRERNFSNMVTKFLLAAGLSSLLNKNKHALFKKQL